MMDDAGILRDGHRRPFHSVAPYFNGALPPAPFLRPILDHFFGGLAVPDETYFFIFLQKYYIDGLL